MGRIAKRLKDIHGLGLILQPRNSSREYMAEFLERAACSLPAGGLVLDAGAGENAPYRNCFLQHRYESADIVPGAVTYVCDVASIPVEDDRFDIVVCTQVLEHVPEPTVVLAELYRVLKPGCKLWLSAPFYYEEHLQPYDFFRYTRFGMRSLIERAGFVIEELIPLEGYFGALSYQMHVARRCLPIRPAAYGGGVIGDFAAVLALLMRPASFVLSQAYAGLDRRSKFEDEGHCKNYCVVATKPNKTDFAVLRAEL